MTRRKRNLLMKSLVYGIFFGAASTYLYMTHGAFVDSTFHSMLAWRDSAKSSVYGYGGKETEDEWDDW